MEPDGSEGVPNNEQFTRRVGEVGMEYLNVLVPVLDGQVLWYFTDRRIPVETTSTVWVSAGPW